MAEGRLGDTIRDLVGYSTEQCAYSGIPELSKYDYLYASAIPDTGVSQDA